MKLSIASGASLHDVKAAAASPNIHAENILFPFIIVSLD
jgi:hypothetical protein